ncbi:MAG: ABC transporter permease [Chloracidobacterium sp.]|uniref:ABC transporter permease n=1 Tax=Chloracidobacterium validum TaxID=2821543 RepID=A0ABX8B5I8_9BACT|nr:ABC transporter permease [Chloracidobacterium validum]QUW02193.1 ABC transporter permease [Chloracidobacterium validum]
MARWAEMARSAARTGLTLLIALAATLLVLRVAGYAPLPALWVMGSSALGGPFAIADTLVKATPLALCGLGVTLAFRGGQFNIGAEGQMLIGALAAVCLGLPAQASWAVLPVLLGAVLAGSAWALMAAWLKTARGVNEVISTLMLNAIAFWLVSWLVHGPLQESAKSYPQTDMLPETLWLTRWLPPTRLHSGSFIALALALAAHVWLFYTPLGLRLRVMGSSPTAARTAGIAPRQMTWLALAVSGGCAGLAGGVEVLGVSHRLYEQFSPGYGYMAVAVALLARQHPLAVIPSAVAFGALEVGAAGLQRAVGVSAGLAGVIEALVMLAVIVTSRQAKDET